MKFLTWFINSFKNDAGFRGIVLFLALGSPAWDLAIMFIGKSSYYPYAGQIMWPVLLLLLAGAYTNYKLKQR